MRIARRILVVDDNKIAAQLRARVR
jgi:CheY-like chemotaxis protein